MQRTTDFHPMLERYHFDFNECSSANGYAQVDTRQDASYYGNWVNPSQRKFVTFAEGDITRITFDDDAEMVAYLQEFKDNDGLGFIGVDPGLGDVLRSVCIAHGLGPFFHKSDAFHGN
jgi:hypothetical protein